MQSIEKRVCMGAVKKLTKCGSRLSSNLAGFRAQLAYAELSARGRVNMDVQFVSPMRRSGF